MERVLAGIRRQILTIIFNSWVNTSRSARRRRISACEKLQSALRKCPSYGVWAGELANLGFHMWHRWANYRVVRKSGGEPPTYPVPALIEWDKWTVKWEERREIKAVVAVMGGKTFLKNKFRRWRSYTRYLAAQNERLEQAIAHHNRANMLQIMTRWCAFYKGRGKAHRRRLLYLTAWKEWAPRKRQLRILKQKALEKVKEVRLRCILRSWSQRVQVGAVAIMHCHRLATHLPSPLCNYVAYILT